MVLFNSIQVCATSVYHPPVKSEHLRVKVKDQGQADLVTLLSFILV